MGNGPDLAAGLSPAFRYCFSSALTCVIGVCGNGQDSMPPSTGKVARVPALPHDHTGRSSTMWIASRFRRPRTGSSPSIAEAYLRARKLCFDDHDGRACASLPHAPAKARVTYLFEDPRREKLHRPIFAALSGCFFCRAGFIFSGLLVRIMMMLPGKGRRISLSVTVFLHYRMTGAVPTLVRSSGRSPSGDLPAVTLA